MFASDPYLTGSRCFDCRCQPVLIDRHLHHDACRKVEAGQSNSCSCWTHPAGCPGCQPTARIDGSESAE